MQTSALAGDKNAGQSGHTRPKRPGPTGPSNEKEQAHWLTSTAAAAAALCVCRPTPQRPVSIHYIMHAVHMLSI